MEVKEYYNWLHRLEEKVIVSLEFKIGKHFKRIENLYWGAREHAKAMMRRGKCYHAPVGLWGEARGELVYTITSYKSESSLRQAMESIANGFLNSPQHRELLFKFNNIGAGLALKDITAEILQVYFTIRLR